MPPLFIRNIPCTPLDNPETNNSSFHILRLLDPRHVLLCVDLLIRDTDLYFVGFRVGRRAQRVAQWVHDGWFCFSDLLVELPQFLNATGMNINCSHTSSEDSNPGGNKQSMTSYFMEFVHYNLDQQITLSFGRAIAAVILYFCEARRLRCMEYNMSQRIGNRINPAVQLPEELSRQQWKRIRSWSSAGTAVLTAHRQHRLDNHLQDPLPLIDWSRTTGWLTYWHLVGYDGDLLLIKLRKGDLDWQEKMFDQEIRRIGNIPNVPF